MIIYHFVTYLAHGTWSCFCLLVDKTEVLAFSSDLSRTRGKSLTLDCVFTALWHSIFPWRLHGPLSWTMGYITSLGSGMKYVSWCHLLQSRALGSEPKNPGTEQDCEATFCPLRGPGWPHPHSQWYDSSSMAFWVTASCRLLPVCCCWTIKGLFLAQPQALSGHFWASYGD